NTGQSERTATSIVNRAQVLAALAKAARTAVVTQELARNARRLLIGDWPDLVRVPMTEAVLERAEGLAWEHGLRGYDSVQLASALTWQESVAAEIVLATFDQQLWDAAKQAGLKPWPAERPGETAALDRLQRKRTTPTEIG